ncbi:DVU_1556 family methyltransferase [Dethiosulfatarculus sandiegensis]|uniref:Methyltransferase type 11 domain-containing protein n=1 Tax=Dethiosulfatarculus sandiegensis TaxID=1429043 RepID=A0A0D2JSZ2_9BACT|nr:class I SAM-dependent methyltransferase [Dethiosulfatarculus sandiegensis]KIX12585.1 hypothetical protein X474_18445 [Dethiosulfatarculus sandiegensis]
MPPFALHRLPCLRKAAHPWLSPCTPELTRHALSFCGFKPQDKILDVGCGTGSTLRLLTREFSLTGVGLDMGLDYLEQARAQDPGLFLIQANARRILPIKANSLKGVLCQCVLSLIEDPEKALLEFHRVLKPTGFLLIMDLHLDNPGPEIKNLSLQCCFTRAVTPQNGQERLRKTGFELVRYEDHSRLLAELGARLIFECGSMNAFWDLALSNEEPKAKDQIKKAKPGFHLMIAKPVTKPRG